MITVPRFLLVEEPGQWDDFTLAAATILLEGEGEPEEGHLAIAWVIQGRADAWGLTPKQVILGPEGVAYGDGKPYEAFSCWGDDYRVVARARLDGATDQARERAWRAAAGALWQLTPNPVPGALFYLNVPLTRRIRKDGRLPTWAADPRNPTDVNVTKLVCVIARHHFLTA